MTRRVRTTGLLLAAITSALLASPGAAQAGAPVDRSNERFTFGPVTETLCGLTTTATFTGHARDLAQPVKGSGTTAFFGTSVFQVTETYTTGTGAGLKTLTIKRNSAFREQTATRIPVGTDPDGAGPVGVITSPNVWRFTFKDAGFFRVYGGDGDLLLKATGVFKGAFLFDVGTDQVPGGTEIANSFVVLKEQSGRSFADPEFCAAVVSELT